MDYDRRSNAYDYDRRRRASGDIEQQLRAFETVTKGLAAHEGNALSEPTDRMDLLRLGVAVQVAFTMARRVDADDLFLAILREYSMGPAERKVVERAAKTFSKRGLNRIAPEKAIATYLKWLKELRLFAETARRVVSEGKKHDSGEGDTVTAVGSFRLINTGGFGPAVMAEVVKVVEKSEKLLRRKGLEKVCYGDVHVTNTVHKSTRVLAFYSPTDDNLYIRANLKGKQGPAVQSVVHELGHRLQFRFLKSKKREIDLMYKALGRKKENVFRDLVMDKSRWPKPEETYVYKGETFVFDKVDLTNRANLRAIFRQPELKVSIQLPLETYVLNKHPEVKAEASVFVTNYAATDPDENFAEMVAFYCEDLLPDDQIPMLEAIL